MSDDRLIRFLRDRAGVYPADDDFLDELAAECRDICLRNPEGYEFVADRNVVVFDVKLTVDAQAVVDRFDQITRAIFLIDGVREVAFTEIPPELVPKLIPSSGLT